MERIRIWYVMTIALNVTDAISCLGRPPYGNGSPG